MTLEQYARLAPYFKGTMARSRVILYLLAEGYSPEQLAKLTLEEFRAVRFLKVFEPEVSMVLEAEPVDPRLSRV